MQHVRRTCLLTPTVLGNSFHGFVCLLVLKTITQLELDLLMHLKKQGCMERRRARGRQRSSVYCFTPQMVTRTRVQPYEVGAPSTPQGCKSSRPCTFFQGLHYFLRHISKVLDEKWNSWELNQCPQWMFVSQGGGLTFYTTFCNVFCFFLSAAGASNNECF